MLWEDRGRKNLLFLGVEEGGAGPGETASEGYNGNEHLHWAYYMPRALLGILCPSTHLILVRNP